MEKRYEVEGGYGLGFEICREVQRFSLTGFELRNGEFDGECAVRRAGMMVFDTDGG